MSKARSGKARATKERQGFSGEVGANAANLIASRGSRRSHTTVIVIRVPALMRDENAWRIGHAAGIVPASVSSAIAIVFDHTGLAAFLASWGAVAAFVAGLV